MLRHGVGFPRDPVKAAAYLHYGCDGESAAACLTLGFSHGIDDNAPHSFRMSLATLLPIAECIVQLSEISHLPKNVPLQLTPPGTFAPADSDNDASETTLLTYEAALGDADAEMDIARTYYHGELGHKVDFDRARQLFERHPDDPEALVYLGKM